MTTSKDLIKWTVLSEILSGSDNSVRKGQIPRKYQTKVECLFKILEEWEEWAVQEDNVKSKESIEKKAKRMVKKNTVITEAMLYIIDAAKTDPKAKDIFNNLQKLLY